MALSRELPDGFDSALRVTEEILLTSRYLAKRGSSRAEAEQIVLAAYRRVTGKSISRTELYARLGDRYPAAAAQEVIVMAGARAEGRLLQHLTGMQFFYEHEYEVGPDVLVPRPETEVLVANVIERLRSAPVPELGLEIGLGSGCISIEILSAFPGGLRILGSELSESASARAAANARRILGGACGRLEILRAHAALSVWEPFARALGDRQADFLVSNPPYLANPTEADAEVTAHEPREALFAPAQDSLYFYRVIAERAEQFVRPGGRLWLELAAERTQGIVDLFLDRGYRTKVWEDLNRRPRVLEAEVPSDKFLEGS